jgi:hypothetical protein
MIAILAIVAVVAILVMIVPVVAASVARNVISNVDRARGASIDASVVEARLGRIEEAIDAMALQIERLSEHQRTLLGPESGAMAPEDANRLRTES